MWKTISLCAFIAFMHMTARSQSRPVFLHLNDRMVQTEKYNEVVEGSAYYNDEWAEAAVLLTNNVLVENVKLRIDLLTNEVHYLDSAGREMISTQPIKSIIFKNSQNDTTAVFVAGNLFPANSTIAPHQYLQLLSKGKASLLKQLEKKMIETKGFGSGTVEKKIVTETKYYLWYNNSFTRVKNVQEITDALATTAFLPGKKTAKAESDLKAAVDAYNKW